MMSNDGSMHRSNSTIVLHKSIRLQGVQAELTERKDLTRQEIRFLTDRHSIFLNIKGAARSGETYLDGRRVGFVQRPVGSFVYVPPGCAWSGWDEGDEAASHLLLSVENSFAQRLFGEDFITKTLKAEFGFRDLHMQFAARTIARELVQYDVGSDIIVEGQLVTILGHLLRRSGTAPIVSKGGLAPFTLNRILDRFANSGEQRTSLSQVAKDAGCSVEHLCRAFRQSTGRSPHAYLNMLRLERASVLLRTTDMSVTEIALACGYSSGSHLATRFSREAGVPPIGYRMTWADRRELQNVSSV
jgi:AraC-like DNA-binding protein